MTSTSIHYCPESKAALDGLIKVLMTTQLLPLNFTAHTADFLC